MKDTTKQQLDLALGIIRELLLYIPTDHRTTLPRQRAENFLKAMEEAQ